VVTWHLGSPGWQRGAALVADRPAGVSLAIILPNREDRLSVLRVLRAIEQSRPQAVLPYYEAPTARDITSVIRREPTCLATSVADFLEWRGFSLDPVTRSIIRRTVQLSSEIQTVGSLARNLYMSRRALGRRLSNSGLPVPSHWLHISRVLRATIKLQNTDASLFSVACSLGYSDGFSLSNQMRRLCGIRPIEARERLGWEWVFETWLAKEAAIGSISPRVVDHRPSIAIVPERKSSQPIASATH
jgi:AraC-like DNA-binding protein